MGLIGNIASILYGGAKALGGLPACVKDIAVAWYKDLSRLVTYEVPIITQPKTIVESDVDGSQNVVWNSFEAQNTSSDPNDSYFNTIYKIESNGWVEFIAKSDNFGVVLSLNESQLVGLSSTSVDFGIYITLEDIVTSYDGSVQIEGEFISGEKLRLRRDGGVMYFERDSGTGSFSTIRTETVSTNDLFIQANLFVPSLSKISDLVAFGVSYINPTVVSEAVDSIGRETRNIYYGQYLTSASGQINLFRSSGTYDYIDPSDGSLSTGNSIPANGLITIPANGICEITTSDGSRYPCCERSGDVLHDVLENSIHISVDTAVWGETLHGSDYLNQYGYITKSDSDSEGYDWETNVDGTPITLDDNCLVPLALWSYQPLQDVNGEPILDVNGEPIEVKENI